MSQIYLDHAATSVMRPEVIAKMTGYMSQYIGNPSATHSLGRSSKSALETARKTIAKHLDCTSSEIIFTSGATEGIHWIINDCVTNGIKRIITTRIEHHAVLDTITAIVNSHEISVEYLPLEENGTTSPTQLVQLLQGDDSPTLVCLMHTNNEIGTILDIKKTARLCKQHNALFFTDAVQAIGKVKIDLSQIEIDYLVASAHKFHGPKGTGFLFKRKERHLKTLFHGGGQEKGLRAGTENVHSILAMTDALTLSYEKLIAEQIHLRKLKDYAISELFLHFPGVKINSHPQETAPHILNITLPFAEKKASMIVFLLDMKGIAISRGSACQSGSNQPSHVLAQLLNENDLKKPSIRISFSYQNTLDDIDALIEALKKLNHENIP